MSELARKYGQTVEKFVERFEDRIDPTQVIFAQEPLGILFFCPFTRPNIPDGLPPDRRAALAQPEASRMISAINDLLALEAQRRLESNTQIEQFANKIRAAAGDKS